MSPVTSWSVRKVFHCVTGCWRRVRIKLCLRISGASADIDPTLLKAAGEKPLLTVNRDELAQLNLQGGKQSEIQTDDAQAFADSYGLPLIARFDKEGAVVCQPGQQPVRIPAYKVPVADTIAAGDSHCAGVLAGLAWADNRSRMPYGPVMRWRPLWSAARSDGAPTRSELSEFYITTSETPPVYPTAIAHSAPDSWGFSSVTDRYQQIIDVFNHLAAGIFHCRQMQFFIMK